MSDKEKLIYLAGIVDGEGHFCRPISTRHGKMYLSSRMNVETPHEPLSIWLKENFGGNYRTVTKKKGSRLPSYPWTLYGKEAEYLAERLQPYLIIRSEQVKRIIPPYPLIPSKKGRQPKYNDLSVISQAVNYKAPTSCAQNQ